MSVKNESQNETPFNLGGHVIRIVQWTWAETD